MPDTHTITPRALDHCVLPVVDLGAARGRYEALGFTVAPEGLHPFGTVNACIYLADGTFLEPLAIADAAKADAAVRDGNVFVARDRLFRERRAPEGFSALVLSTDDAAADHEAFEAQAISAGPMLDFSRAYVDAAGASREVSFRLAFAAPDAESDCFFFTCQRIAAPQGGRGELAVHRNSVTGISGIDIAAEKPAQMAAFLEKVVGAACESDGSGGFRLGAGGGAVLRVRPSAGSRQGLTAIRFAVSALSEAETGLAGSGIAFERSGRSVSVPPATGQGAVFVFEASR